MKHAALRVKMFLVLTGTLLALSFLSASSSAQNSARNTANIQLELVRTETGFFEAWKTKDLAYFRDHIAENGISWGETGTSSRAEQLQEQESSAKVCRVDGYGLSEFAVLALADGAYLLTYKAEQYAICNGEKVPVHMNGSSIYVLKAGHWQAIYRAEIPLKNQS
jgi:hypothetical protein